VVQKGLNLVSLSIVAFSSSVNVKYVKLVCVLESIISLRLGNLGIERLSEYAVGVCRGGRDACHFSLDTCTAEWSSHQCI
jgi:hypothetical protein